MILASYIPLDVLRTMVPFQERGDD